MSHCYRNCWPCRQQPVRSIRETIYSTCNTVTWCCGEFDWMISGTRGTRLRARDEKEIGAYSKLQGIPEHIERYRKQSLNSWHPIQQTGSRIQTPAIKFNNLDAQM